MALTAIAQSGPPTLEMTCGTSGAAAVTESSSGSNSLPICTDPHTVRYMRIAFHYLLKENNFNWSFHDDCTSPYGTLNYSGPGNFTEISDGDQNAVYNGSLRAEEVVAAANAELAANHDAWRKVPESSTRRPMIFPLPIFGMYWSAPTFTATTMRICLP